MKTQQRKFVVERKSGRRRRTTQPPSIWGDTDLKAFARKAEADAPYLFEPDLTAQASEQDGELRTGLPPKSQIKHNAEPRNEPQIPASSMEVTPASPPELRDALVISPTSGPEKNPISGRAVAGQPKRQRRVNVIRLAGDVDRMTSVQSTTALIDDLSALDEENRRLKGLLAEHLLRQNAQLRKMLARFAVVRAQRDEGAAA